MTPRFWGMLDLVVKLAVHLAIAALLPSVAVAHTVSERAQHQMLVGDLLDAAWIGAEHMLTGYDHLLFLLGVILFLNRFSQIVVFITAFTIGHTSTLLGATLAGVQANPYMIDAVIALTVTYKAVENLDGFRRWLGVTPPQPSFHGVRVRSRPRLRTVHAGAADDTCPRS